METDYKYCFHILLLALQVGLRRSGWQERPQPPMNAGVGECVDSLPALTSPRTESRKIFLYEALMNAKTRSQLWDHMQFWEDTFFDLVAQERDILGLDQDPMGALELFARHMSASERRHLLAYEDRLLAICLHNLIACMVMMGVETVNLSSRVHRIHARCRLGAYFSGAVTQLLADVTRLHGNTVRLLPSLSKVPPLEVQEVEYRPASSPTEGDPVIYLMEVYPRCFLLRDWNGAIARRICCSDLLDVTLLSQSVFEVTTTTSTRCNDDKRPALVDCFHSIRAHSLFSAIRTIIDQTPAKAAP